VEVLAPDRVDDLSPYRAVVLGSAVYAGRWVKSARELAARLAESPSGVDTWLFSSGPIGDPPKPEEEAVDVAEIMDKTSAREHRVFPGKIDKSKLNFAEKAIVIAVHAAEGDFRDWDAVDAWAGEIAESLVSEASEK
jgi:menaquinone-dependent protoporphyrinogen oxidase